MIVSMRLAVLTTRLATDVSLVRGAQAGSLFALQLWKCAVKVSFSSWLSCVCIKKAECYTLGWCYLLVFICPRWLDKYWCKHIETNWWPKVWLYSSSFFTFCIYFIFYYVYICILIWLFCDRTFKCSMAGRGKRPGKYIYVATNKQFMLCDTNLVDNVPTNLGSNKKKCKGTERCCVKTCAIMILFSPVIISLL